MSADKLNLGQRVMSLDESPSYDPISCVRLLTGTDQEGRQIVYTAGDQSGRTLDVENRLIRDSRTGQAVAQSILQVVQGYAYKPYSASGAILDPAAEIGDGVSVDEVYSVLADIETTFSPLMTATISAPEDSAIDHEYPYESSENRTQIQEMAQMRTSLLVEQGRIAAIIEDLDEDINGDDGLFNQIASVEMTAKSIVSTVAASQNKYVTTGITIDEYGYGPPTLNPAQYNGKKYLDQSSGLVYTSNGKKWTSSPNPLQTQTAALESKITQTASSIISEVSETYATIDYAEDYADGAASDAITNGLKSNGAITKAYKSAIEQSATSIKSTVAANESKWDLSELPTGVSITNYGYGKPSKSTAADHAGEYYLNNSNGRYYLSNGTDWVIQSQKLKLITTNLSTKITQTANGLESVVEEIGSADENGTILSRLSKIEQTPSNITLSVESDEWGRTSFTLKEGNITLSSKDLYLNVDSAHVTGAITADYVRSNVSIVAPTIYAPDYSEYLVFAKSIYSAYYGIELRNSRGDTVFQVYDGDFGNVSLSAKNFNFVRINGERPNPTVYAFGNWDFSNATVTGL